MKIKETKTWKLLELPEDTKEKAIENLADINIDHEWWDFTYDDARNVHLEIDTFDLSRHEIEGYFKASSEDTAREVIKTHGTQCETVATSVKYLGDRAELVKKYSDGIITDIVAEDNEYDFDNDCDDLDNEFLRSILEDYRIMLSKNYDYMVSEEAIIETINANDYDFDVNGRIF